jgi:hypothetical protein
MRGNTNEGKVRGKIRGWMDGVRRSTTNHGLPEQDATGGDMGEILVFCEGKPVDKSLQYLINNYKNRPG